MGQIESTVQNEAGIFSKEKEEKENQGQETESGTENKEMLHCVKNRIDMLIEGCLLSKEPGDTWVPDGRIKKSSSDVVIEVSPGSENPKDADNGADLDSDCNKIRDSGNEDADVFKNITEISDNKVTEENEIKEKCDKDVKDEKVYEISMSEQNTAVKEVKKEIKIKIEDTNSIKVEDVVDAQTVSEKREKLKMSDIISEMTRNDMSGESHKKKLTTFQTFIDRVLDNSLHTMKVEKTTNILELCSKSMTPSEKQTPVNESSTKREGLVKTENVSESIFITSNNGNPSQNNKTEREKSVKSEVNMISLKDHIERFLERSFQESKTSDDELHSVHNKQGDQNKDSLVASKSGNSENFNAQGLVNNMINQGLQINKLLSPTSSKGKEVQKSPNVRSEMGDIGRKDYPQMPYDNRQYVQNPKYSEAERININRQYTVSSKYSTGPQRSPNGSNPNFHEMEPQRGYLVRPKVEYPDYKTRMYCGNERQELVRDEHMLLQERYPSYPTHKLQKPVPHIATTHTPDNTLHPGMMYPAQFSPRHPLLTTTDAQKEHAIGLLQESMNNRGYKQAVHLRDCKCAMCVPHPDPRYQGMEHKSPDYLQTKLQLSPSTFPQFGPSHPIHPAYLSFQRLQTPQDQSPAMMRPSHSAVPPGCLGYQMPKLLPQHPPIASPKEYSQLHLTVPPNIPANKNTHPSHRLSTEENISAEMYAAYRQTRVDPASAYQKRPKEHEMAQSKYGGYPSPSPRRPSSASRDDQRKEVHDILLSPDPRTPGNDWGRRRDCPSNSSSSSASGEIPLDLSFKKSDTEKSRRPSFGNFRVSPDSYQVDPHRPRTQNFVEEPRRAPESPRSEAQRARAQTVGGSQQQGGNAQRKDSMLFNTFIKHLESSVDKYCQELKTSPPLGHSVTSPNSASNKSGSPNETSSALVHGYQGRTSPSAGPQIPGAGYRTLSPCAPYAGGITLGQPIIGPEGRVHMDNRQSPKQTGIPPSSSSLTQPQLQVMQPQPVSAAPSANFVSLEHAKRNNISKHEPIQNIIGNHDPNDILYLICRLCSQTYGSPYGFRKHFRNQHGFEPRAEDTIVQTISATKKNLSGPNAPNGDGIENTEIGGPQINTMNVNQEFSEMEANSHIINESSSLLKSNSNSSQDLNSLGSEEETSDKSKPVPDDTKETKCLECPECGKTFQLNDFGSYKRHCRQHNSQVKMNGTLTCSKCHLSFADQHLLKEHYNIHVKEPQTQNKTEKPVSKTETPSIVHSCVPCDKSFDDISAYQDHVKTNHNKNDGPPKLSPQINLVNENTNELVTSREDVTETKWPDISFSVIPSHDIVKQAAESMTASACPDSSSWSDTESDKHIAAPSGEKVDDGCNESYDANLNVGENVNENNEKSEKIDYFSQKSVDSSQDTMDEKGSEDGCEFRYVHKKFSSHRKRAFSSCSQSNDTSVSASKQSKLSPPVLSRSDTPVTSCSVLVTNESADSTETIDCKGEESLGGKDCPIAPTSTNDLKSTVLDGSVKQEARHHLPFVWDRVTRSQVGRKTK